MCYSYGSMMIPQRVVAIALVAILSLAPFSLLEDSNSSHLDDTLTSNAGDVVSAPDIVNYRNGDKWVYETQFDVAALIAQANVSASINTLTGDTDNEITDIYFMDIDGIQTLVYETTISGDFTSGNSGATLEGISGKLNIAYDGVDIIRVRDLALVNNEFTINVDFLPYNIGIFKQDLADLTFDTWYLPPKEKYDFPLHTGDQWYMPFQAGTTVTGSSDYFDPSDFDTNESDNSSWQVTSNGVPSEDGTSIQYTGCDDSYKIMEWNETGVNVGFQWYCPAVRGPAWTQIVNSAGFTIDWLLKKYSPADSWGVQDGYNPGTRNVEIDVGMQFIATLPESTQEVSISYMSNSVPQANKNLQLRYELNNTIENPTTDGNGDALSLVNSSTVIDDTPSSDDHTSNGVIVWDPVTKIIGAATLVVDLSVVGVDLIAQSDSIIVTRQRGQESVILSQSIGYAALPGDILSFSIPAQNRGVLTSPSSEIEVITPDGASYRESIPPITPYSEQRVITNWTVMNNESIGNKTLSFTVDPDQNITQDANRSNNYANVSIFIGRAPSASMVIDEGKYTFENVTFNATASFDEDSGDVECRFELKSRVGLIDVIDAPDCWTQWNWSNSGDWNIKLTVTDDELDIAVIETNVTILNRAPYINLSMPDSISVEDTVTIDASDSGDIDTTSPSGQEVTISWPGTNCQEGFTQPTCTFTAMAEGEMVIVAEAMDDDGTVTTVSRILNVLNIAPTLNTPELWDAGQNISLDANGTWHLNEDQVILLRVSGDDTLSDRDNLNIEWQPSNHDLNWTETTNGPASTVSASWQTSGEHIISVAAWDDDGEKSETKTAKVMISNVAPSITGLPGDAPIFEDDDITFSVEVSDTVSDIDSLQICWDLNGLVDLDSDGDTTNDCQEVGANLTHSWTTTGVRWITATVTDDDGASASQSVNISVQNLPPRSVIDSLTNLTEISEGDSVSLSAMNSIDTEFDKSNLVYQWKTNHLDTDLDGDKDGDIDYYGINYTMENMPVGTWDITLIVIDDNNESASSTITIVVKALPSESIIDSISGEIGSVGTGVLLMLIALIVVLVAFLLITRRTSNHQQDKYQSQSNFATTPLPSGLPNSGLFEQATSPMMESHAATNANLFEPAAVQHQTAPQTATQPAEHYDIYSASQPAPQTQDAIVSNTASMDAFAQFSAEVAQPQIEQQPTAIQPVAASQGPPLPATGLPDGWTQQQWDYYGQQWLDANKASSAVSQPITTNTTPSSASTNMSDLLDDLDF